MKVPQSYVGRFVCVQLAAPVYMFEYGAHVLVGGDVHLMPAPMTRRVGGEESQAMSNLLTGARVASVEDDAVVFELFDPKGRGERGNVMRKLVPCSLIMSIDTIDGHDVAMPSVKVIGSEPSRIVTP